MAEKTHHGSCRCGAVRYEADIDFEKGSGRCNCTVCLKTRHWAVMVKPEAFRLMAGEENLTAYGFSRFCKTCGVRTHSTGDVPEIGGPFVSVQIAPIDDLSDEERAAIPVAYADGRNDNWWSPPAVTSFL
jgi:hypothetical protein